MSCATNTKLLHTNYYNTNTLYGSLKAGVDGGGGSKVYVRQFSSICPIPSSWKRVKIPSAGFSAFFFSYSSDHEPLRHISTWC